ERAELVDMIGHRLEVAHVALVPDARREAMRVVGLRMDRAVLGVDAGPAAFGLERAVRRLKARSVRARADAVRHLIKAIAQRLRADLDGLEQDVVLGIARHGVHPLETY